MRKHTKGTPFPTGLFKSKTFLRKVDEALGGGMIDRGVTSSARPQLVRVRDARIKKGITDVKVMVGDTIGACYIAGGKAVLSECKGKGAVASAVVLPRQTIPIVHLLRTGDCVKVKKVRAAKGLRAAHA